MQEFISKPDMNLGYSNYSHRRYNPLIDEWVLVSPHRSNRPWKGKVESIPGVSKPKYDPECYLCPGNLRANGERNPDYKSTYVFTNDFAALLPDLPSISDYSNPLMQYESLKGTCRVICFSPRHDLTLAEMPIDGIKEVVDVWVKQTTELGEKYRWVQIFENKGEIMGCSNSHPHCQIWACSSLPNEAFKENNNQLNYLQKNDSVLLVDYLTFEIEKKERIVAENEDWVVVVPFWAVWPFETLLLPRRHVLHLPDLNIKERINLAKVIKILLAKYDNLFKTSFPYTMGWHGAPNDERDYSHWQLHAHYYPPLLRSSTVKKFMVGYEMLSEPQRDITAETAVERLKNLSEKRFF